MRALLTLLALIFLPLPTFAVGLNDTGIPFCSDDSTNTANCAMVSADSGTQPRQDARYGRDAAAVAGKLPKVGAGEGGFDFTALDASGQPTRPTSGVTPHPCVRDNLTGLVWEVKTDDDGLRDQDWTYTWYDSVHNYRSNAGTASGTSNCQTAGRCDTEKYVADVNATALCGYTDWRMPSLKELQSIVHLGSAGSAIEPTYFPNTVSASFWSGSPGAGDSNVAWSMEFGQGYVVGGYRNSGNRVRLVRGGDSFASFDSLSATPQSIAFGTAPSVTVGGTGTVSATASSGLAVTFSSTTTSICSVSGNTVTGVAAGTCTIAANQAGDANYSPASEQSISFSIVAGVDYTQTVEKLYVAYFGRPGNPSGLAYWTDELVASNGSSVILQNMFTAFYLSAEYISLHAGQTTEQLVNSL